MKKVLTILLILLACCVFCACTTNSEGNKGASSKSNVNIEIKAVDIAIENWINSNSYMFIYDDYDFTVSNKIKNDSISGKDENGNSYQYYNVYGNVNFYDEYGDLKKEADFTVVYAYNGDRFFVADERTDIQ